MKYSDKDLNQLAQNARDNLIKNANKEAQDKKDVEDIKQGQVPQEHEQKLSNETEDLYAEFKDEGDQNTYYDGSGTQVNAESEQPQLQTYPNYDEYAQQTLRANPTDEELEELPGLEEYEEPIFEGGPTQGQVLMWKKQWAGYDILATEITDKTFIFRTMNRFEYKQLVALTNIDATRREEIICETCTLWPAGYNWRAMAIGKAGIPSTYSKIIMQKSGFTQEYKVQVI